MKPWDAFIKDSTKQFGYSDASSGAGESKGGGSKDPMNAQGYAAVTPPSLAELYKNASPYMRQLAAKYDEEMRPV